MKSYKKLFQHYTNCEGAERYNKIKRYTNCLNLHIRERILLIIFTIEGSYLCQYKFITRDSKKSQNLHENMNHSISIRQKSYFKA
jgi:hypothetical protein